MTSDRRESAISLQGVAKRYSIGTRTGRIDPTDALNAMFRRLRRDGTDEFWALRDITLDVSPGEVLGIIGPNGAGKSTILKLISRITVPTEGRIVLRGQVGSLLEVGTGFHPELTGRDNIYLNGAILGMTRRDIDAYFDDIVAFAGVSRFLDTPVKRYSTGMFVRLGFAVAAHLRSDILLVDEVLSVGDARFQQRCLEKIDDVTKDGRTVVFVSHQLSSIRDLCRRVVWLEEGRIVDEGPSATIIDRYLSTAVQSRHRESQLERPERAPVAITRIAVRAAGRATDTVLDVDDQLIVEIEHEVSEPSEGVEVGFRVQYEGTVIFVSLDVDTDRSRLGIRRPGRYRSEVKLPRKLLKPGRWSLDARVSRGIESLQHVDGAVHFELHEVSESGGARGWSRERPGVLIIPLEWRTHPAPDPRSTER